MDVPLVRYGVSKSKFRKLRALMLNAGFDNSSLGELLGRAASHISRCLNAKSQWKLDEVYKILEAVGEKPENIHEIFPKDGIDKDYMENRQGDISGTPTTKDGTEYLQLLPPVKVGRIGNCDVFIAISYR